MEEVKKNELWLWAMFVVDAECEISTSHVEYTSNLASVAHVRIFPGNTKLIKNIYYCFYCLYWAIHPAPAPLPSKNVFWTWSFNPVGEDNWCLKQGAAGRCTDLLAVVLVFNTLKGTQVEPWSEAPVNCGERVCRSVGEYHRQGCQLVYNWWL